MVNTKDNINTWVHSLIVWTYIHGLGSSSGPFGQMFCGMGRIPNGFIPFSPMENFFSQFIDKTLKF